MAASKNDKPSKIEIEKMSFETALAELETIVQRLDSGDVELEESIRIYERGTLLKSHCEAKLADAQARVQKLSVSADGKISADPLDVD